MNINKALAATALFIVLAIIYVSSETTIHAQLIVEENGSINTYFCPKQDCLHEFIKEINASENIKCAFYSINEEKLITSLKNKDASIIIHESNHESIGIPIQSRGLMHHKFCVLDNKKTITGSYNPTGSEKNNKNNIVIIESETIAKNYAQEFKAIRQGSQKKETQNKKINLSGKIIKIYFCPQDKCKESIIKEIMNAKESIYFMTFTFTDKEIAAELAGKHAEGIHVKGIIENFQRKDVWVKPLLDEAGINTKIHSGRTLQHNKVFIIDNETIITGSYNPTRAAHTINDENILIITSKDIAVEYAKYFIENYEALT